MKKERVQVYILLHVLLMFYSATGIFSKLAAGEDFLSIRFCLYYGIVITILFLYAIGWQRVLKKLPVTTAFANKAVTTVWGSVWGLLFFHEQISIGKVIGIAVIIAGIIVFVQGGETDG